MENKIAQFIFDRTGVPNFEKFLDLSSFRHKLIGGNVANSSTPGYKAQQIEFHEEFNRLTKDGSRLAGSITHPGHIPTGSHEMRPPDPKEVKVGDGELNSVDIDKEISSLAQNELMFTIGARLLQMKFDGIKKAITSE